MFTFPYDVKNVINKLCDFCQCHDGDTEPETKRSSDVGKQGLPGDLRLICHLQTESVLLYDVYLHEVFFDEIEFFQTCQNVSLWKGVCDIRCIDFGIRLETVFVQLSVILDVTSVEGKFVS